METINLKNDFEEIMRTMNNGLHNDSTLYLIYPLIVRLCLVKNPDKIGDVMEHMHTEEILTTRSHPGLNNVVDICLQTVQPLINSMSIDKEVVGKTV